MITKNYNHHHKFLNSYILKLLKNKKLKKNN
jgi:hypothetical protein